MHRAQLLYNCDSYLVFEREKNILSCAIVITDLLLLPPFSQSRFLFTNELNNFDIVVLCDVSHEKSTLKLRFLKTIESKLMENIKSRIVTTLVVIALLLLCL